MEDARRSGPSHGPGVGDRELLIALDGKKARKTARQIAVEIWGLERVAEDWYPRWYEPCEWLGGAGADRHPLHLISNQPATRLHSQLDNGRHSRAGKLDGREPVAMHPADAAARGIAAGDAMRVFNDRGACLATAVLSEDIRRGVVRLSTGAWFDPETRGEPGAMCKHGNPNVLTPDKGTSRLAQGPIAHTCLVEVERFEGVPPEVTAFEPPEVIRPHVASEPDDCPGQRGRTTWESVAVAEPVSS